MIYYKLIQDNNIIGVATDADLLRYQQRHGVLERANVKTAEYLEHQGVLYRDAWMRPLHTNDYKFSQMVIRVIDESEYLTLLEIFKEEPAPAGIPDIVEPVIIPDPEAELTIETIKEGKITLMSKTCNQLIEAGFDIELNGQIEHFSLTTQDQLNLISLSAMVASGAEAIPYHADGQVCRFYSNAEMTAIVNAATNFKIYHTTYYNALKNYINSLNTLEALEAIQYGIELPEEFQSEVLKAIENNN